ncbi:hypothetical protein UFOVP133_47 [uncultured Caudovirales phage]|uniref:Uncharacterized protein n=1 Tax=uncultured Caudovirales phage TaxID=2100421 RepID=A0A6J5LHP0_9CAUD|nr:hypothetical protein UFOVP133_47 [uncultured Caudovirales phage]
MSYKPRWDNGDWNVICDSCGRMFKDNELRLRWDGLMVCSGDWEPRQPQDFVHGVADKQAPPWARPESSDNFIFVCTPVSNQGIADYGQADCARAGIDNGYRPICTMEGSIAMPPTAIAGCAVAGKLNPGLNDFTGIT